MAFSLTKQDILNWKNRLVNDQKSLKQRLDSLNGELQRIENEIEGLERLLAQTNGALNIVEKQLQQCAMVERPKPEERPDGKVIPFNEKEKGKK